MTRPPNILPCMRDWWEKHKELPPAAFADSSLTSSPKVAVPRAVRIYYPISDEERRAAQELQKVRFGSLGHGKYVVQLAKAEKISEGGRHLLWRWVYRYRRQIRDKALVEIAKGKVKT